MSMWIVWELSRKRHGYRGKKWYDKKMSNNKQKYLAGRILWRRPMTVLGRVGFSGVLLTHWVSACFSHLHPRNAGKWLIPFSHGRKNEVQKTAVPGAAEVWWDRDPCPCPPPLHPSRTSGWFHHSPHGGVTWEGMQGCSWTTLPNSSARKGFLHLLWGNSHISPKTAQQVETSWPSPRCAKCPFMSWTAGGLRRVKPAASTRKKMHCSGGADKIPQPRA